MIYTIAQFNIILERKHDTSFIHTLQKNKKLVFKSTTILMPFRKKGGGGQTRHIGFHWKTVKNKHGGEKK